MGPISENVADFLQNLSSGLVIESVWRKSQLADRWLGFNGKIESSCPLLNLEQKIFFCLFCIKRKKLLFWKICLGFIFSPSPAEYHVLTG